MIASKYKRITTALSKSSLDSEFIAMAEAVRPLEWLVFVLADLGRPVLNAVPLLCDSQSAITTVKNGHHSSRTRHIALAHNVVFHFTPRALLLPCTCRLTTCRPTCSQSRSAGQVSGVSTSSRRAPRHRRRAHHLSPPIPGAGGLLGLGRAAPYKTPFCLTGIDEPAGPHIGCPPFCSLPPRAALLVPPFWLHSSKAN
jgi:hypothetical protein